jgi:hypothetical protein
MNATWEALSTNEQRTLLKMPDQDLSKRFGKDQSFFQRARAFFESAPQQIVEPKPRPHSPPKDLVVSARRDLSFFEANFELFDNSIDRWRRGGAKKDLHISVKYDLELLNSKYVDDAGGFEESDVYKVFIPGETANRDFSKPMIGSFGMGAKKGIFRLTDGAKIISGCSSKFSATSEVPEKWETNPTWETLDGRAKSIGVGTTEIYLFKLFDAPTPDELTELTQKAGMIYRPLLLGEFGKKVRIEINGVEVQPGPGINWSAPKGSEPRVYTFAHDFLNFLNTGNDIKLALRFKCGITRKLPGTSQDTEEDWGIDVYGNGRLVQRFLKDEFGFGTTPGLAKQKQASRYFRGELFIDGHSFAIPWDTHKREYLRDHPVSRWLRDQLVPVIKSYVGIAARFTVDTGLRTSVLLTSVPKPSGTPKTFNLDTESASSKKTLTKILPQWTFGPPRKTSEKPKKEKSAIPDEEESKATLAVIEDEERALTVSFTAADYDELQERFAVTSEEEVSTAIRDCLTSGVAFTLNPKQLSKALKVFHCDGSLGELSETIKGQLLKKLAS